MLPMVIAMHILKRIIISKWSWDLSLALAKAEFKIRYEGSYLGVFWYLINPLLTFTLLFLVFASRLGQNISYYPLYLLLGIVMFNYFHQSTHDSTRIINENRYLIKSISFPFWTLISSTVLKLLFSHIFEMLIFFIFMIFLGSSPLMIIFYPLIIAFFSVFVFGVSLIFASISVYFIDFENIWIFASRLLWFATPIFYEITNQKLLYVLNMFNPLFFFISFAREVVIYSHTPSWWLLLGTIGYTFLALIIGLCAFNKLKAKMTEMI